ncbi:MAG: hypothetical protein RSA23_10365 [Carnobacterium sp.]
MLLLKHDYKLLIHINIMNKMDFVREMMKQLNITRQEVVNEFAEKNLNASKFLTEVAHKNTGINIVPSKKFVTPKKILPGMFEYADGLIFPEVIPENQLRGVVGAVNKSKILVWCLHSKKLEWSKNYWHAGTDDLKLRGWEATERILQNAKRLNEKAPAAEYCANYAEDGVEQGSAFLLSYADALLLKLKIGIVREAFSLLKRQLENHLWSSSEYSYFSAWISYFTGSYGLDGYCKDTSNYRCVRPVRMLEL